MTRFDPGGRRPRPPRNPGGRTCLAALPYVLALGPYLVLRGWLRDRRAQ